MNSLQRTALVAGLAVFAVTGCSKKADNTSNYKSAINGYLEQHKSCLYSTPQQFPQKVDASNQSDSAPLNALYDQHLLNRKASDERVLLVVHKTVNIFDLSDQGRSAWTPDPNQPGYGNFCYGHRVVSSIDSSTPTDGKAGATTTVSYHYDMSGVPDWAKSTETQTAFPGVASALSGGQATANLIDTSNGWAVQR